jgi:hypothetical protein
MMAASPTARSLDLLRKSHYLAAVVERWNPHVGPGIRQDLFGFADILAVHPRRREFLLVQTTSLDHVAHRLAKSKGRPELAAWLRAGGLFQVHGWKRRGVKWEVKIVAVAADDLVGVVVQKLARRGPRPRQRELFDAP